MKALVTGGAGFIGRSVVRQLQSRGEIVVLDNLRSGAHKNLEGLECELVVGSILDRSLVRNLVRNVDYVFHLAAMVGVPESIELPEECAEINGRGTSIVLEEAAAAQVKKFIFSSSAAVYGERVVDLYSEELSPHPNNPYAASKRDGEIMCAKANGAGQIRTVALRYFNVFGPFQNPHSAYAAAVPAFVTRALRNEPLIIFGDGEQTRDFIHVVDVARANVFFALESDANGVFNVASGRRLTINELAQSIRSLTHSTSELQWVAARAGDIRHSVAKIDNLRATGFTPVMDFETGLNETIEFFKGRAVRA